MHVGTKNKKANASHDFSHVGNVCDERTLSSPVSDLLLPLAKENAIDTLTDASQESFHHEGNH